MSLHVDLDTIMRFVGKYGDEEAREAYQDLLLWSKTKQARTAIWHAGQTLRAVECIPPYMLRGSEALVVSHAVIVLWTYSMMLNDAARRTGSATPSRGKQDAMSSDFSFFSNVNSDTVLLNGPSTPTTEAYLLLGSGKPCLRSPHPLRSNLHERPQPQNDLWNLRNPSAVMKVSSVLLQNNCPNDERENLPQMIRSLCDLMDELGNLK
jgi:hypothetical protein